MEFSNYIKDFSLNSATSYIYYPSNWEPSKLNTEEWYFIWNILEGCFKWCMNNSIVIILKKNSFFEHMSNPLYFLSNSAWENFMKHIESFLFGRHVKGFCLGDIFWHIFEARMSNSLRRGEWTLKNWNILYLELLRSRFTMVYE